MSATQRARCRFFLLVATLLVVSGTSEGWAQLFGSQTAGRRPSMRRSRPGAAPPSLRAAGTEVRGSERFVRGNRRTGDFVGTDSREARSFVGSEQATGSGSVRSAVDGLREKRTVRTSLNQPRTPIRPTQMYDPKLKVAFDPPRSLQSARATALSQRLTRTFGAADVMPIGALVEGRKAIVYGTVASERDRYLAELLVLLEPGISDVQNDLVVKPRPRPAEPLPAPASGSMPVTPEE